MKLIEQLQKAKALISNPDNWCKRYLVRHGGTGNAYCARGALNMVAMGNANPSPNNLGAAHPLVNAIFAALPPSALGPNPEEIRKDFLKEYHIATYNNSHTHADIMAVFDRAIERQKQIDAMLDAKVDGKSLERVG